MKKAKKLKAVWKRIKSKAVYLLTCVKKNATFILALITAIALISQNVTIRQQVNLYEDQLQDEQKPIMDRGVGEFGESKVNGDRFVITEHIINIGKLPAYNVTRRDVVGPSSEYPYQHFSDLMNEDSLHRNILLPGIPRVDTISLRVNSDSGTVSVKELAYTLYSTDSHLYVHFWTEYMDIADRFYVLQQTFELHGRSDSTMFWGAYHAIDEETDNPYR